MSVQLYTCTERSPKCSAGDATTAVTYYHFNYSNDMYYRYNTTSLNKINNKTTDGCIMSVVCTEWPPGCSAENATTAITYYNNCYRTNITYYHNYYYVPQLLLRTTTTTITYYHNYYTTTITYYNNYYTITITYYHNYYYVLPQLLYNYYYELQQLLLRTTTTTITYYHNYYTTTITYYHNYYYVLPLPLQRRRNILPLQYYVFKQNLKKSDWRMHCLSRVDDLV